MELRQIGDLSPKAGSSQGYRVYDPNGLCPSLEANGGGYGVLTVDGENMEEPVLLGGLGERKSNGGTQDYQQDRVFSSEGVAPAHPAQIPGGSYKFAVASRGRGEGWSQNLEVNGSGNSNALTTVQKDNLVQEQGCNGFNNKGGVCGSGLGLEILRLLREKIGEKDFSEWAQRGIQYISQAEILRQNLYEKSLRENREEQSKLGLLSLDGEKDNELVSAKNKVRRLWEDWKNGCSPYRRRLSEQQYQQLENLMQELSYENPPAKAFLQDLWKTCEGIRILRQTLSEVQEIWKPSNELGCVDGWRIRKLTERECGRLMGVKDTDIDKMERVSSKSRRYAQFGNSIVTSVLSALFLQMGVQGKKRWNDMTEKEREPLWNLRGK